MSRPAFASMDELLQRLLDGAIQPDEMKRLEKAMREDVRVRDYYVDSMLAAAVIRRSSQVTGELGESDLIQALSGSGRRRGSERTMRRLYWMAAALIFGLLTLTLVSTVRQVARGPAVGTLAGAYEAQWHSGRSRLGEALYARPYDLREGAARMELGSGTSLVLEAPCQVELSRVDEVILKSGRLVVAAPSGANGFRVRTRTALITDLGTEFGVVVHSDGSTEAHVLSGRIMIALDPDQSNRPTSMVVIEGQAGRVDASGQTLQGGLAARPDLFLLELPPSGESAGPSERLNLADVVGQGNGRGTGILNRGIDPATGQAFENPVTRIRRARQNQFQPTPQWPGVDGVFVPNGAAGPVVISSTGLTFAECPDTLGSYYGGPANSGEIYDIPGKQVYVARLNGIRYGTSRHPALSLHPNAGITFDLDQIRQDHPNVQIERFTAVCGIPKDLPQAPFSAAEVWVLLDGVVYLHLRYPVERYVIEGIEIPIPSRARFLTLVATCTGRADYSWIFFGDPFLGPAGTVQTGSLAGQRRVFTDPRGFRGAVLSRGGFSGAEILGGAFRAHRCSLFGSTR
ncbi:MAG TPA: hypothetical protein ENN87_07090 [Phycisphaerales bacterium]|nr:hypothetical protein [Phycisphaerales bacterium]